MSDGDLPTDPHNGIPTNDAALLQAFAKLVKKFLAEHEERELGAIQALTKQFELFVRDARGWHLESTQHAEKLAGLEIEIGELRTRLDTLEKEVAALKTEDE